MARCPRHAPHGALVSASAHAHSPALAEYLLNPEGVLKKVGMMDHQEDRSVIHRGEKVLVGKVEAPRSSLAPQQLSLIHI